MAFLGEVLVQGKLDAHRVQPRARHDHRLRLVPDLICDPISEVLHADDDLLVDRVGVQIDEGLEQILRLPLLVPRVALNLFEQPASRPCRSCSFRARQG